MMDRRAPRYALVVPGILLIVMGVAVLIEPRILAWFAAFALIIMGSVILMITRFVRSMAGRPRDNGW